MERISKEPEDNFIVMPETVHTAKRLKGSLGNWWLIGHDTRFNTVLLRTLRDQISLLRECIPLDAVRSKDKIDVQSCIQISQPKILAELEKFDTVSQVIVPEKYRLWESNKPRVLKQTIAMSTRNPGKHFVLDLTGKVSPVRFHYPADVTVVDSNLRQPHGVTYLGIGILLISEPTLKKLHAVDITGHNMLNLPSMTVADIKKELRERGLLPPALQKARKAVLYDALQEVLAHAPGEQNQKLLSEKSEEPQV